MQERTTDRSTVERMAITVRGVVQGVGFRPFVYNAARAAGLCGWVRNETDLVRIEVEGDPAALDTFLETLRHKAPPQAHVDAIEVSSIDVAPETNKSSSFEILPSCELAARRPAIPADLATCSECTAEIRDPRQRRYGYPFTNCTNCGPRWSIIEGVPYDRPRTSMSRFAMCEACQAEYVDPADRRFHAQPIACPECGPQLQLLDPGGALIADRDEALAAAAEAMLLGKIVAMKGLGGFQLLVDATDEQAVALLRRRKRRPAKPLAVMVESLEDARRYCHVNDDEAALLCGPAAPIVLLQRREGCAGNEKHVHASVDMAPSKERIAESVAPGNPELGVMLPYTPLHHLLMDRLRRPIVCTSGNLAEEPMATHTHEALERLGRIADVVLTHNRPIVRPVDDSVVRCDAQGPIILRRARGYAPLPIDLGAMVGPDGSESEKTGPPLRYGPGTQRDDSNVGEEHWRNASGTLTPHPSKPHPSPLKASPLTPIVLAVGGHLKNTVALRLGRQVVVGSHVGDLDSPLAWDVHRRAVDDLVSFFDVRPEVIACDAHPDYMSTGHAEELAERWGVPLVRVQHHHAHVAACMAEHGLVGPVLGLAWDGSGYGPDGTVWGGEALWCEGSDFRRVAHLRQFYLPGGDQAVRRPRRTALGLLYELDAELAETWADRWFTPGQGKMLLSMLRRETRCPRTSSMGRLFDAVAAVCGLPEETLPNESTIAPSRRKEHWRDASGTQQNSNSACDTEPIISFEGEAAMALQFAAEPGHDEAYPIVLSDGQPSVLDWGPMLRAVLNDRASGVPVGRISARFHNTMATMALEIARHAGCSQVVLSGGCFQNRLLVEGVRGTLSQAGFNVYTHKKVPPGDGGVALGQAFLAEQILAQSANEDGS